MLPYSILPPVLAGCFLLIWAFVAWLECEKYLEAARRDGEAPERLVY
jgi:hypothetical protein